MAGHLVVAASPECLGKPDALGVDENVAAQLSGSLRLSNGG